MFGSLGKIAGGLMGGGLGPIIGGTAGLLGDAASYELSRKEASKNRSFQEEMSNTSYQRQMADMKKAGLNPILSAKIGGASTPGGAQAQVPNMMGAVTSAESAMRMGQQGAQTTQLKAQTEATNASTRAQQLDNEIKAEMVDFYKKNPTMLLLDHSPTGAAGVKKAGDTFTGAIKNWWKNRASKKAATLSHSRKMAHETLKSSLKNRSKHRGAKSKKLPKPASGRDHLDSLKLNPKTGELFK